MKHQRVTSENPTKNFVGETAQSLLVDKIGKFKYGESVTGALRTAAANTNDNISSGAGLQEMSPLTRDRNLEMRASIHSSPKPSEKYLSRREAAAYLKDRYGFGTVNSLAKGASLGTGPVHRTFVGVTVYLPEDLDDYAMSRLSGPATSATK